MAVNSEELFAALPEARQKAILARTDELIAEELTLAAIREARQRSQEAVAKKLGVQQPTVSKIERQTDMYLSTLRSYRTGIRSVWLLTAIGADPRSRVGRILQALDRGDLAFGEPQRRGRSVFNVPVAAQQPR
jgi:DNA-binding XRE family transcriptional regulator